MTVIDIVRKYTAMEDEMCKLKKEYYALENRKENAEASEVWKEFRESCSRLERYMERPVTYISE